MKLHDQIATQIKNSRLVDLIRDQVNPGHGLARFLAAVDKLKGAPADEIEWAFRGVLDLYSSRLDAWFTSLAHARLARHRATKPAGVHLGCYGWIENLTPDQANNDWEQRWVRQRNMAHALCCRADAASDVHRDGFAKALKAGVKMALGSDIRPLKDGALLELGLWVRDGATPWQALVAATRNSAALCGVGNELGTIEVGKLADLIVGGGNPLEDIQNVRQLKLVLKEGVVVSDKRG